MQILAVNSKEWVELLNADQRKVRKTKGCINGRVFIHCNPEAPYHFTSVQNSGKHVHSKTPHVVTML